MAEKILSRMIRPVLLIGFCSLLQWASAAEPALRLVGTVNGAGEQGHALMVIDGKDRLVALQDTIGGGWRLAEIH